MTKELRKFDTIRSALVKYKDQMSAALPSHMSSERMLRIVTTEFAKTPRLQECSVGSVIGSFLTSAQIGLEPGPLGHIYFVPYKDECTIVIGYKGMIELARRSGKIKNIYSRAVYENDKFEIRYGIYENIEHEPSIGDKGKMIGVYAVAHLFDGGYQIEWMSTSEIEKNRSRSKTASYSSSPWNTDYEEMCKKTVIRRLFKYLPVSIENMQSAITADERDNVNMKPIDLEEFGIVEDVKKSDLILEEIKEKNNIGE